MFRYLCVYILASIPILLASILFITFDLDVSSPRKDFLISDRNLAASISQLSSKISKPESPQLTNDKKEASIMTNNQDNKTPSSQPQQQPQPQPPIAPKKPELQYSTENFKEPMPNKPKILNENK